MPRHLCDRTAAQRALCVLGLLMGLPAGAGAQDAPSWEVARARLESRLPALLDSGGVPGMAIGIVRGGEVRWTRGFGVRRSGSMEPVDENTVFEAASLSKPVIAYAALRLVDRGVLDLDRPLAEILPLPGLANDSAARRITARMVLSHTTGLPNEAPGAPVALAFTPGSGFRYSGEGYAYLGQVLERLAGTSLEALLQREVFVPLGMRRSAFTWQPDFDANAATGHDGYGTPLPARRPAQARAPSSLQTTAADYARFLLALTSGAGLGPAVRGIALTGQVAAAEGVEWGLGWSIERVGGRRIAWHHGDNSNTGFTALAMLDPGSGDAVVFFANSTTGLGIAAAVLQGLPGPLAGPHPALDWIGYEAYDAPTRRLRLALERKIREEGVEAGVRLYRTAKAESPAGWFPETLLNSLGYRFLALGRAADAVALFELNVAAFPASANAYDSLGDGLAAAGQTERAIRSYQRSLDLDPRNSHAVEMIARLRR